MMQASIKCENAKEVRPMPKPQIPEVTIFEGASPGEQRAQVAKLAGSQALEAAQQAESRAIKLHQHLRDRLGIWINDGVRLESVATGLPYHLTIEARNRYGGDRTERTHTELEVVPANGGHKTRLKLDTTEPQGQDPVASLEAFDPETGEEYPVTDSVIGRLETDIRRELDEEHFSVQPLFQ
jgi:hypothetical protein